MKVKEVEKTANVAWSPAQQFPVYLAMGTAAQQLDATFSTSASLDLYALNLTEPGLGMGKVGSIPSDYRFHKLVWNSFGMSNGDRASGLLMGGADSGKLFIWDPAKIMNNEDALVHTLDKHTGGVSALDPNPFQTNLLASGASDSEIYIWDLNNVANPMTPGQKSQPPDDVTCVSWNRQVQHIMASTYAGRCVVWDLRKNEPIIKVSDSMSRIKCKLVSWHPEVATQMCLASEDDHTPVIQLWDLRFATSPLKSLESHQRGILSMAWCPQDPDLLLSCGKDNRILCWNPNSQIQTGEVVYELPTSNQWSFDVQWCPRNPAVISSCSFDGHISVYSLMGGTPPPETPSKIADSFPTDPFAQASQQQQQTTADPSLVVLKKPPKWLRRPVGASFTFGGKLVTFENIKPASPQQPVQRVVNVSQVVTETDLINRSNQLENAMAQSQFSEFCSLKITNSKSQVDEDIWKFLKVNFETDPRTQYLNLLGYDKDEVANKIRNLTGSQAEEGATSDDVSEQMAQLNTGDNTNGWSPEGSDAFDQIAAHEKEEDRTDSPLHITVDDECSGLVAQALLTANFEAAVEVCLHNNRMAEAIILANAGGPDLLTRTQKKFFHKNKGSLNRLISSVVTCDFESIIRTCEIENWKEALAMALTYAKGDEFSELSCTLGSRLESEKGGEYAINACLCYIVAGNVERLVECWNTLNKGDNSSAALQDLVEKVMVLRKAVEIIKGRTPEIQSGALAQKLSDYASLLAAQGNLQTAVNYLGNSQEPTLAVLRDRLYSALGVSVAANQKPFGVINVQPEGAKPAVQPQAPQQQPSARQRTNSGYYNSSAGTNQTTTTPSSTYNYTQSAYPGYSGAAAGSQFSQPTYSGGASSATGAAPLSKGPLSQKYPAYSQSGGFGDPYANTAYSQANYPTSSSYGSSNFAPASQSNVPGAAPQLYDPTTANTQTPDFIRNITPTQLSSKETTQPTMDSENIAGEYGTSPVPIFDRRRSSEIYTESETTGTPPSPKYTDFVRRTSFCYTQSETPPRRGSFVLDPTALKSAPYAAATPPSSQQPAGPAVPSYQDARPDRAWNDPPPVSSKKKQQPSYDAPAPITTPIFGVPQSQPMDQGPPGAPSYTGAAQQVFNPAQYQQPQQQQPQQQPAAPVKAPEPPKPVQKAPIPAENVVLQEVFDKLANMCMNKATNPQVKRKLEDVFRKLDALYDKLRGQSLSPNIVLGLHQIIQAIQGYDYQTGLAYHTQMISQGNFSEISSFMPGIKVLMQTAMQLQVYVQ